MAETKTIQQTEKVGDAWTRKHYNVDEVNKYDLKPATFIVDATSLLKRREAQIVLDAGCGQGRHVKYLIEQGFKVVGVDASKKALELCSQLLAKNSFNAEFSDWHEWGYPITENCRLMQAKLQELDRVMRHQSVDAVIAVTVMTHIPEKDVRGVLDQVEHVLRPGGIAIMDFASPNDSTYESISKGKGLGNNAFDENGTYVKYWSELEVYRLFTGTGFQVVDLGEVRFLDQAHPGSRPFPHWHSSFVVVAQKGWDTTAKGTPVLDAVYRIKHAE